MHAIPEAAEVEARVRAAVARRAGLDHPALRLVNGPGDALPRLLVERYGDAVWVRGAPEWAAAFDAIRAGLDHPERLYWRFGRDHAGGAEQTPPSEVDEAGLRFGLDLGATRNTGLFLDGRGARAWVRAHSEGRRVLNLFAYTCAFGVCAAAGGARSTANVDLAGGALDRGRLNYQRNGFAADSRTFWKAEASEALRRLGKGRGRFDGIILDPPPIPVRVRGRKPDPARQLHSLVRASLKVLDPGGWLLVLSAARRADPLALPETFDLEPFWQGQPEADCPPAPDAGFMRAVALRRRPDLDS